MPPKARKRKPQLLRHLSSDFMSADDQSFRVDVTAPLMHIERRTIMELQRPRNPQHERSPAPISLGGKSSGAAQKKGGPSYQQKAGGRGGPLDTSGTTLSSRASKYTKFDLPCDEAGGPADDDEELRSLNCSGVAGTGASCYRDDFIGMSSGTIDHRQLTHTPTSETLERQEEHNPFVVQERLKLPRIKPLPDAQTIINEYRRAKNIEVSYMKRIKAEALASIKAVTTNIGRGGEGERERDSVSIHGEQTPQSEPLTAAERVEEQLDQRVRAKLRQRHLHHFSELDISSRHGHPNETPAETSILLPEGSTSSNPAPKISPQKRRKSTLPSSKTPIPKGSFVSKKRSSNAFTPTSRGSITTTSSNASPLIVGDDVEEVSFMMDDDSFSNPRLGGADWLRPRESTASVGGGDSSQRPRVSLLKTPLRQSFDGTGAKKKRRSTAMVERDRDSISSSKSLTRARHYRYRSDVGKVIDLSAGDQFLNYTVEYQLYPDATTILKKILAQYQRMDERRENFVNYNSMMDYVEALEMDPPPVPSYSWRIRERASSVVTFGRYLLVMLPAAPLPTLDELVRLHLANPSVELLKTEEVTQHSKYRPQEIADDEHYAALFDLMYSQHMDQWPDTTGYRQRHAQSIEELHNLFKKYARGNPRGLNYKGFRRQFRTTLVEDEMKLKFTTCDLDGDGFIQFEDYCKLLWDGYSHTIVVAHELIEGLDREEELLLAPYQEVTSREFPKEFLTKPLYSRKM